MIVFFMHIKFTNYGMQGLWIYACFHRNDEKFAAFYPSQWSDYICGTFAAC